MEEVDEIKSDYLKEIFKLLQECMDVSLIDLIYRLLQKSC